MQLKCRILKVASNERWHRKQWLYYVHKTVLCSPDKVCDDDNLILSLSTVHFHLPFVFISNDIMICHTRIWISSTNWKYHPVRAILFQTIQNPSGGVCDETPKIRIQEKGCPITETPREGVSNFFSLHPSLRL